MKRNKADFPSFFSLRAGPFGLVAALWSVTGDEPKLCRILLSGPERSAEVEIRVSFPDCVPGFEPVIDRFLDRLEASLSGEAITFSLDSLRLDLCTPFQKRVLLAEYAIPRGRVSTYKLLANHVGSPGGARAAGSALANNPFPIVIPCHRAIRSDGGLGGFQYGLEMKRKLLEMEGVSFRDEFHVAGRDFFYSDEGEPPGRKR